MRSTVVTILGAIAALFYAAGIGAFIGAFVNMPAEGVLYGGITIAMAAVGVGVIYGIVALTHTLSGEKGP